MACGKVIGGLIKGDFCIERLTRDAIDLGLKALSVAQVKQTEADQHRRAVWAHIAEARDDLPLWAVAGQSQLEFRRAENDLVFFQGLCVERQTARVVFSLIGRKLARAKSEREELSAVFTAAQGV